ncbi:MAG: hypothetical protein Q8P49_01250 [Candidatus Liptonbacteria bacterium]|nr:hypothetical protein [Candidatus Liptonbacteria bacterium]
MEKPPKIEVDTGAETMAGQPSGEETVETSGKNTVRDYVALAETKEKREWAHRTGRMMEEAHFKGQEDMLSQNLAGFDPPIKPGKVFDPERVGGLYRIAPKKMKKELVRDYKEKLIFQKQGITGLQVELSERLSKKPDMDREQLLNIIGLFAHLFGFTLKQVRIAEGMIDDYIRRHTAIREVRKQFPSDDALFKELFGRDPHGKIEVVESPASLYFRCFDAEDYALIFSQKFLVRADVNKEDVVAANMSGGVSIPGANKPGLEGAIIAENTASLMESENTSVKFLWKLASLQKPGFEKKVDEAALKSLDMIKNITRASSKITHAHENRHAVNNLFKKLWSDSRFLMTWSQIYEKPDQKNALVDYVRGIREENSDDRIKDEILAFLYSGTDPESIFSILTREKEKGGLYDFLSFYRTAYLETLKKKLGGDIDDSFLRAAIEKVFVDEHRKLIKDGIDAFVKLEQNGYSKEGVVAALVNEPLTKWKKVANRLLQKSKQ